MVNKKIPKYLRHMGMSSSRFNSVYVEGVGKYLSKIERPDKKIKMISDFMSGVDLFLYRGDLVGAYKSFKKTFDSIPNSEKKAKAYARDVLDEVEKCAKGEGISLEDKVNHTQL